MHVLHSFNEQEKRSADPKIFHDESLFILPLRFRGSYPKQLFKDYAMGIFTRRNLRMTNKLQEYFPMIQTRESIMEQIEADRHLKSMFEQWGENHRQEFLDFCTGVRGAHVIPPTCCSGSIRESAANGRRNLSIKISRKSTPSSYLSRAHRHSISFQIHISTILNRNPIPG